MLVQQRRLSDTLNSNVTDLTTAIKEMGNAGTPAPASAAAATHDAHVKELITTIKKGLEEGMTPLF